MDKGAMQIYRECGFYCGLVCIGLYEHTAFCKTLEFCRKKTWQEYSSLYGQILPSSCCIPPLILERKVDWHAAFGIVEVVFCREPSWASCVMRECPLFTFASFFLLVSNFSRSFQLTGTQNTVSKTAWLQVRREQEEQMDSSAPEAGFRANTAW